MCHSNNPQIPLLSPARCIDADDSEEAEVQAEAQPRLQPQLLPLRQQSCNHATSGFSLAMAEGFGAHNKPSMGFSAKGVDHGVHVSWECPAPSGFIASLSRLAPPELDTEVYI